MTIRRLHEGDEEAALRKCKDLAPERLRYEMISTGAETVPHDRMETARGFLTSPGPRKEATDDLHPGS